MRTVDDPRLRRAALVARAAARWAACRVPDHRAARFRAAPPAVGVPRWQAFPRRVVRDVVARWLRLRPVATAEPFTVVGSEPPITLTPSESYIVQRLYWLGLGSYEPGQPAAWATLVRNHDRVVELGANIGLYTVTGATAAPGTPYVAVEANPLTCASLRRNLAVNGLDHVEVVEAAAVGAPGPGRTRLWVPDADPYAESAGAYVDGDGPRRPAASHGIEVTTVPVTHLVAGADLLKLDIEGLELDLLEAVRGWLVDERPTLVVEVLPEADQLHAFLQRLASEADYRTYAFGPGGLVSIGAAAIATGELLSRHGTRDVALLPRSRAALAAEVG